ncbi:DoxX family protein [Actinocorallia sp. API 0066]|uniref:MauE/DoxX family redox-associated membrane protein n=1 Tax=Actinocorallia sp. API 0066 TaxID=2896846 RepID=UPI001E59BB06|nr:DoxX family protein [Actinocorallia sp. API 0066]MCD0450805.1 DoxX family protein [Actinocorallia sp. API 0066]
MTETRGEPDVEAWAESGGRERAAWIGWVTFAARLGLAGVLFWAGWTKFTEPVVLQRQAVDAYQILPEALVGPVGVGLPVLEMVLALLLVVGFATRLTAVISGVLMALFIAGIASAWARGLAIDCGCFGGGGPVAEGETKYLQEIVRDVGFLALAVWITVFAPGRLAVDRKLGL